MEWGDFTTPDLQWASLFRFPKHGTAIGTVISMSREQ